MLVIDTKSIIKRNSQLFGAEATQSTSNIELRKIISYSLIAGGIILLLIAIFSNKTTSKYREVL